MDDDALFDIAPLSPLQVGELVLVRTIIGQKPARVRQLPMGLEVEIEWVAGARPWGRGSRTHVHIARISRIPA